MKTGMIWSVLMAVLLMSVGHAAAAFGEDLVSGTVETGSGAGSAETATLQTTAAESESWHFFFAPYIWAVKTNGDMTLGPVQTDFTLPFSTALNQLKGGFFGHFEAHKNHMGVATDIFYTSLAKGGAFSVPLPNGSTTDGDLRLKMTYWELWPYYRFGGGNNVIDVFGGIRYSKYNTGIDFRAVDKSVDRKIDWVDPMFGARWIGKLSPKVALTARGDIGGFGAGSKFTFNIQGNVVWQFHRVVGLGLGYRWLNIDYEKSRILNPDFFKADLSQYGPIMAITFSL